MLGLAERTLRILLPMEHRHKVRLNYKSETDCLLVLLTEGRCHPQLQMPLLLLMALPQEMILNCK